MKTFFRLLISCVALAYFTSCVQQPTACFTTDRRDEGDSVKVNTELQFFSCSNDTDFHHWEFGDSTSADNSGTAIKHTYKKAGNYTVTLHVRNGSKTDDISHPIAVIP